MKIDPTVHDAIASGAVSVEQVFDAIVRQAAELELNELAALEVHFIARGAPADGVRRMTKQYEAKLNATRLQRLEAVRWQLAAGVVDLQ